MQNKTGKEKNQLMTEVLISVETLMDLQMTLLYCDETFNSLFDTLAAMRRVMCADEHSEDRVFRHFCNTFDANLGDTHNEILKRKREILSILEGRERHSLISVVAAQK